MEYVQWENLPVCLGSKNLSAPDRSRDPNIRTPTTIIRLALYMSQQAAIVGHHVTLLLMGKDCFDVDINLVFNWWLTYCQNFQITMVIAHHKPLFSGESIVKAADSIFKAPDTRITAFHFEPHHITDYEYSGAIGNKLSGCPRLSKAFCIL